MKYLKVNWYQGDKEGYFIQSGETYEQCRLHAYSLTEYEDVNIKSFQFSNEDDYESYIIR